MRACFLSQCHEYRYLVLQGCRVQEVRQVFSDWASLGRVTWHDGVTGLSCSGGPPGVQ